MPVVRGKKGEDGASSPRAVVSFECKGIHISTRRKKRRTMRHARAGSGREREENEKERGRKRELERDGGSSAYKVDGK